MEQRQERCKMITYTPATESYVTDDSTVAFRGFSHCVVYRFARTVAGVKL
jgi:hypothetical protein